MDLCTHPSKTAGLARVLKWGLISCFSVKSLLCCWCSCRCKDRGKMGPSGGRLVGGCDNAILASHHNLWVCSQATADWARSALSPKTTPPGRGGGCELSLPFRLIAQASPRTHHPQLRDSSQFEAELNVSVDVSVFCHYVFCTSGYLL